MASRSEDEGSLSVAAELVATAFGPPADREFDVRYWNGDRERGTALHPRFAICFNAPSGLRRMLLPPSELAIAEAYLAGEVDVEGDLTAAMTVGDVVRRRLRRPGAIWRAMRLASRLPRADDDAVRSARFARDPGARHGDAGAIRHHYDVGNDFYELWLDDEMLYTCAYFRTGSEPLSSAQLDKLELLCRKLRLKAGETLLDIGCGWGGLVRYAAARYGVTAHGITLSAAQAEYAQQRIAREGLGARCRVEVLDYRDLAVREAYDKVVAVGVTEHVAAAEQPGYFSAAYDALRPGGLFLNHCEVSVQRARARTRLQRLGDRVWKRNQFIERYVFPDARLVPAHHVIGSAESAGFELRDVESLREHYALTLRHWLERLEARREAALALIGPETMRVWRLYMSAGVHGFESGRINIIQTLLAKPADGRAGLPWSREDLYARGFPSEERTALSA